MYQKSGNVLTPIEKTSEVGVIIKHKVENEDIKPSKNIVMRRHHLLKKLIKTCTFKSFQRLVTSSTNDSQGSLRDDILKRGVLICICDDFSEFKTRE